MGDKNFPLGPVPGDPGGPQVAGFLETNEETWLTCDGDIGVFAAQTFLNDGSGHQNVICLSMPLRKNKGGKVRQTTIMMSPEDAAWFVANAIVALEVLEEVKRRSN